MGPFKGCRSKLRSFWNLLSPPLPHSHLTVFLFIAISSRYSQRGLHSPLIRHISSFICRFTIFFCMYSVTNIHSIFLVICTLRNSLALLIIFLYIFSRRGISCVVRMHNSFLSLKMDNRFEVELFFLLTVFFPCGRYFYNYSREIFKRMCKFVLMIGGALIESHE